MTKEIDHIFTEFGIGNDSFVNTEIEYIDGTEDYKKFKSLLGIGGVKTDA